MFSMRGAKRGARLVLPIAVSVFAYGSVFGVLARQTGMSLLEAASMSGLVFAGSAQFIVLDLWHTRYRRQPSSLRRWSSICAIC